MSAPDDDREAAARIARYLKDKTRADLVADGFLCRVCLTMTGGVMMGHPVRCATCREVESRKKSKRKKRKTVAVTQS